MTTKLQDLAVALFRSVKQDESATWATMTAEERDAALQWATDAMNELRGADMAAILAAIDEAE